MSPRERCWRQGRAEWGFVWGVINLGGPWPRGLHGMGQAAWAGGCQRGVPALCPLRLWCCLRRSWSIARAGMGHGAGRLRSCVSRAVEGTPGEMCGGSTGVCSPQHAGEHGVVLRLCLPARGARHLAPAVLARSSRLWHGPSRDLPSRAGIGRAGDATCIPPSRIRTRPLLCSPGAGAWAGGGEHGSLASSQGALSPARSLGLSPTG